MIAVHDVSFRSLPGDFAFLDGLRRRTLVGASLAAASGVLACSEFTRRELIAWHPAVSRDACTWLPLGPDDDLPAGPPRLDTRQRTQEGPRLLSVGAILNRRRLPVLIEAAGRVETALAGRLALDVVGENRTHPRLDLASLAERHGLAGRGVAARLRRRGRAGTALRRGRRGGVPVRVRGLRPPRAGSDGSGCSRGREPPSRARRGVRRGRPARRAVGCRSRRGSHRPAAERSRSARRPRATRPGAGPALLVEPHRGPHPSRARGRGRCSPPRWRPAC